jgi:hypothetical protein
MGALDPHNMLQLQRWRRRGKKGKKKRKSYVKGKVIDGRHELYTLSIAMMLGLRTSIARTNTIIASADRRSMLTPQDFMAEEKYEFAPKVRYVTLDVTIVTERNVAYVCIAWNFSHFSTFFVRVLQ